MQTKKEKKTGTMKKVSTLSTELTCMKNTSTVYVFLSILYPDFILVKKTLCNQILSRSLKKFTFPKFYPDFIIILS